MRTIAVALVLLFPGGFALAQQERAPVPKPELQFLSQVVSQIHEEYAGPVDDAKLAAACASGARAASGLAGAAGGAEVSSLTAIPPLLQDLKAKADPALTYRKLAFGCASGMMESLDARSGFLDPEDYRELQVGASSTAGIGLELRKEGDAAVVVGTIAGGPAERAALAPGDRLVRVDGERVAGMTLAAVVNRLRGKAGSEVALSIERGADRKPHELAIKREIIRLPRVNLEWLEQGVLGIRIRQFYDGTRGELIRELEGILSQREPSALLPDLRDNSGGLLYGAVEVAGVFLQGDALIGTTKGRSKRSMQVFKANDPQRYSRFEQPSEALARVLRQKPMAVLVNAHTASGAEIAAAALQGNGRATLVGAPTFGTGSIQTIIPLKGDGALRLTTSYWFGPGERKLEANPLRPDVEVKPDPDSIKRIDAARHRAIELPAAKAAGR